MLRRAVRRRHALRSGRAVHFIAHGLPEKHPVQLASPMSSAFCPGGRFCREPIRRLPRAANYFDEENSGFSS